MISGRPDKVNRATALIEQMEKDRASSTPVVGDPQMKIYQLNGLDGDTVLKILQTVTAGEVNVHFATDPQGQPDRLPAASPSRPSSRACSTT